VYILLHSLAGNPGLHWFAIFRNDQTLELFDSGGADFEFVDSKIPRYGECNECEFNERFYQGQGTITCGDFCIYFILNRLYNLDLSFTDIMKYFFSRSPEVNEKKVKHFLENECL